MDPSHLDSQAQIIEGILGPHEVGVMLAIFLFGLVTIQAFTYFREYPSDPKVIKILVSVVWTLLLVHTSISAYSIYQRTVKDYGRGNLEALDRYPEGMCGAFSLSALIGSIVQSYFAQRLRKLSGNSFTPILCWFLSLVRLGSVICISVTSCQATSVRPYVEKWKWLAIFALSVSAFVDLLIAGSLAWCLWRRRGHVFVHAQRVVDKLIAWTIQTGALTSISSILMLVLYAAIENFAWVAAYQLISGLFANFLLASLNARDGLRDDMNRKPTFFDAPPDPHHTLRNLTAEDSSDGVGTSSHARPPGMHALPLTPNTI